MTIDNYLTLSITDCKRLGFLRPGVVTVGRIEWKNDAGVIASVGFSTKTQGVPVACFSYEHNGTPRAYDVALRWKRSNLSPGTEHGYYYFVCPATGALCRKLYFVNGQFVGRTAFKALYKEQTLSVKQRRLTRAWRDLLAVDDLINQQYRRETYRGRLTPYGRKVAKLAGRLRIFQETPGGQDGHDAQGSRTAGA